MQVFKVNRRDRRKKLSSILVSLEKLGENHEEISTDIRARLKTFTPQCENIEEKPTY